MTGFIVDASAAVECLLRTPVRLTVHDDLENACIVASELIGADHVKTDGQGLGTLPVHCISDDLAFWQNRAYTARIAPEALLQLRFARRISQKGEETICLPEH